jgi:hypothetical protein
VRAGAVLAAASHGTQAQGEPLGRHNGP